MSGRRSESWVKDARSGKWNKNETLEAWADITIKEWRLKLQEIGAVDTQTLIESFVHHIVGSADGDIHRITFAFEFYGVFVHLGVGRGVEYEEVNSSARTVKEWINDVYYENVGALRHILVEKYAQDIVGSVVAKLEK